MRTLAGLALAALVLVSRSVSAQFIAEPIAAPALDLPAVVAIQGPSLGISMGQEGLVYSRLDLATGLTTPVSLDPQATAAVARFMARAQATGAEVEMVAGLSSYLAAHPAPELEKQLFTIGPDGRKRLTQLGRNLFMDILTARDGTLFREPKLPKPGDGLSVALGPFDWGGWDKGRQGGEWSEGLQAYAFTGGRATTRVMVAAAKPVGEDKTLVKPSEAAGVIKETGLDGELLAKSQAKVVRAMGNLVVLEVPTQQAAGLGLALEKSGIESRPARVFQSADTATRAAVKAVASGQGFMAPFFQPLPSPGLRIGPENAESRDLMNIADLWKAGMTGKGAIVGIIDTGLDANHPDFKGRIVHYEDLTGEGQQDFIGHGTHVSGSLAGSGEASEGRFKGMAPDAQLVMFKVFDKDGNTSEDTILAAMRKAAELPKEVRPQVLNMSLGGPGDPENDPIGAMANKLMIKDNILVVAAAGNAGPGMGTVGAPGNAEYVMSVGGVNKKGEPAWYASRGPVQTGSGFMYDKPDLSAVAGDVTLPPSSHGMVTAGLMSLLPALADVSSVEGGAPDMRDALGAETGARPNADPAPSPGPAEKPVGCVYAPGGVISDNSADSAQDGCVLASNPRYRYMSGTSMAAPMAAGVAGDVAGYLNQKGVAYRSVDLKAVLMETSADLGHKPEIQGAGLIDGRKLAQTVLSRVAAGVPVGNLAYMLSLRLTTDQRQKVDASGRYERTALGVLDRTTGHLVNSDADLRLMVNSLQRPPLWAAAGDERLSPPPVRVVESSGTDAAKSLAAAGRKAQG